MFRFLLIPLLLVACFASTAIAQTCPLNIDFELGSFQNWQCYRGTTSSSGTTNVITVSPSSPTAGVHVIIPKGTLTDPYGGFPTSAPGGGAYSVKLGNNGTGAMAERMSYLFSVPVNQTEFVITYQYAVVLEDPGHVSYQQPRFTAKVFDITANSYVTCGSFDYVATANLPGFKKVSGTDVIYKEWTPVTINLYGYQGHQLSLEFTTADCTASAHFGYAYVDVNANCNSLISGTDFCPSEPSTIVKGPSGFSGYKWYNSDRSKLLGTSANLVITPPPPDSTVLVLEVTPFAGFGCPYTTGAILHALPNITFKITDPAPTCFPATINLTDTLVTQKSDSNLKYTYWQDRAASVVLNNPNAVTTTGTYYIKSTAPSGCTEILPVNVVVNQPPVLKITNPITVCLNTPVDITLPAVVAGSSTGVTYSYWADTSLTIPLVSPRAITKKGSYFIKALNLNGCATIKPVVVSYYPLPVLIINNPSPVCFPATVDITAQGVTAGSDANLNITYWTDSIATKTLIDADKIAQSGIYYIRAINLNGCMQIKPVTVTVNALPVLPITNPLAVCKPDKVDITASVVTAGSTNIDKFSYWRDANATIPLPTPKTITDSGTYYIKATSKAGCEVIKPVLVTIHNLPVVKITNPRKVYIPQTVNIKDGAITKGSSSNLTYTYWTDASATNKLSNPEAIDKTGTYYIEGTTQYGCSVIKAVEVNVGVVPQFLVPKAFTPAQNENNRLYPFMVAIKTFSGFKIYNRWGNMVFQTDNADPKKGWDGVYKGQMQFLETYTWYAEGYDYLGNYVHQSGSTILLK